ncbi:hypothetical protein LCGC14_0810820 [marine sediment metagenome]|uniref:Uncharacterized protein n=1 Tax=marine sediment metagenome TaxID=412755 RepID=A0A0F9SU62_9ZZZZ
MTDNVFRDPPRVNRVALRERRRVEALGTLSAGVVAIPKSASDTVGLAITETTLVQAGVAASDLVNLAVSENVASLKISLSSTEILGLGISEQNQLTVSLSASDAVSLAAVDGVSALQANLAASDAVNLGIVEGTPLLAVALSASDAVTLDLIGASDLVKIDIITQADLPDLLDEIADCIKPVAGIRDVDAFAPVNLGALPRVVLRYSDTPWSLTPNRNEVRHEVSAEIVFAPIEEWKRARRGAAQLVNDVKATLQPGPTSCITSGTVSLGVTALRERRYHDNLYAAVTINIRIVEVTSVTFA